MSENDSSASMTTLLATAHALVDRMQAPALASDTDDALLDDLRELERLSRRLDSTSYALIGEAERRGLPEQHGCRTTGRWLRHLLRLHPLDADARASASAAAAPRVTLSGEPLPPVFELVAAGQAAGVLSQRQALVIERTVDALPDEVQAQHGTAVERDLVRYAADFDPQRLAVLARRVTDHLHPDGTYAEPEAAQRRRHLQLVPRADGTSRLEGELTPELTERLQTVFDILAAPTAAVDGVKDLRTAGQRQHDALLTLTETAVRTGQVPSNNGVSACVVVTMTTEQYLTGSGLALTGHGHLVAAADAIGWGGGDTAVLAVALNSMGAVSHYGHAHRIFTEGQRRVIAARDRGCTFPGCHEPPGRCQVDHIPRHEDGGLTSVDHGALECRYHHSQHERWGWTPTMIDKVPYWIPPRWIDPAQVPRRNTLHDTAPAA